MSNKINISDDDLKLFREAMKDVKPLKSDKRAKQLPLKHRKKYKPIKKSDTTTENSLSLYDDFESSPVAAEDYLQFIRSGIQPRYFSRLQQGKLPIEDKLDLHGFTVEQARSTLQNFIHNCNLHDKRVVCIIHGKGARGKEARPIIKNKVNTWLRQDKYILAFCSAQPRHGGTGAVYVLLKSRAKNI